MKKVLIKIAITFVILSAICLIFWKVGWLTSTREVALLFAITCAVIAVDLAWTFVRKKIHK